MKINYPKLKLAIKEPNDNDRFTVDGSTKAFVFIDCPNRDLVSRLIEHGGALLEAVADIVEDCELDQRFGPLHGKLIHVFRKIVPIEQEVITAKQLSDALLELAEKAGRMK